MSFRELTGVAETDQLLEVRFIVLHNDKDIVTHLLFLIFVSF